VLIFGEASCRVATEETNKEPLRALLWSNGFVEDGTEIASYTGCTKVDSAILLGHFLTEKAPHVHLVIHRDRDYLGQVAADNYERELTRARVTPFLTETNDIESYFLNAEYLHALNPNVTVEGVRELLAQATAETAAQSIEAVVNQRTAEAFRQRRDGGQQLNHGAIAVQAQADYAADPIALRRGKDVLGRLHALLQQELGVNPRIFHPSQHLRSDLSHIGKNAGSVTRTALMPWLHTRAVATQLHKE